MEIDDSAAAGTLVQAVDVLRHEVEERAGRLPCGEGAMRGIWCSGREARPPDVGARPVAPVDLAWVRNAWIMTGGRRRHAPSSSR